MSTILARNVSLGWLEGIDYLLARGGRATQLVIDIAHPLEENAEVRRLFDAFVAERKGGGLLTVL